METKKYRLKENHDLSKRVNKALDCLDKLGLSFTFSSMGHVTVTDLRENKEYSIEDIEGGEDGYDSIPFFTEFKITYEE